MHGLLRHAATAGTFTSVRWATLAFTAATEHLLGGKHDSCCCNCPGRVLLAYHAHVLINVVDAFV
jgi:hypothetical protein